METNKERKLEDIIRKSVKEAGLESPSADFTASLLSKIEASAQQASATVYKPLISKAGWAVMSVVVVALIIFALYQKLDIQLAWLEKMNMATLPKIQFTDALPTLAMSNIFLYSLLIFGVFVVIQMVLLKKRLDRQYA
ncbi:MAG: hypothetical protein KJN76_03955 [Eudoraea sp.]|nr:hypothetical protein [Eudoraea sp.]